MVATDVASRGIGMIKTPSPLTATPSRLYSGALLSTLRCFLDRVILLGLYRIFWFSNFRVSWILGVARLCCARNSKLDSTLASTRYGIDIS